MATFSEDFRRLFARGLVAILPTLVTFWLVVWAWNFLWDNLGRYILAGISRLIWIAGKPGTPYLSNFYLESELRNHLPDWAVRAIGVGLAVLSIYLIGLVTGNLLGRTFYRLAESLVLRLPLVRAVYPAVKQVTDFLLADRKQHNQFSGSRVVAVRNHESNIWSVGLYTGSTVRGLDKVAGDEMVTVFIPSTPTAFTGYVVVAPRKDIVELPLTTEEAFRLLVSGGVVSPTQQSLSPTPGHGEAPPRMESVPPTST